VHFSVIVVYVVAEIELQSHCIHTVAWRSTEVDH